ncbi:MAG: hypothetical protein R2941_21510, partial [Desulfobacterales bacterium]
FYDKMKTLHSLRISDEEYEAKLSIGKWKFGPCVLVTVFNKGEVFFRSKVLCSPESKHFGRVSGLSNSKLVSESWELFNSKYPFEKLKEVIKNDLMVIVGWPV